LIKELERKRPLLLIYLNELLRSLKENRARKVAIYRGAKNSQK